MKVARRWKVLATLVLAVFALFFFALPRPLFRDSYSTVLDDRSGQLLSATIASDGQWRFPETASVPRKFAEAIILFEDKRFEYHPGFDLISMARAVWQDIRAGEVVSGGSTLSMQVIRLSRKGQQRTVFEKLLEVVLAIRLEVSYSKKEILQLYASHAPFGGNVVGIEAACWRYFGRDPSGINWSEAALLAILPNNPSLIHLGKNRDGLKLKRDRFLVRLKEAGAFDRATLDLAIAEPIPVNPLSLPAHARHLLQRSIKEGHAQSRLHSTLELGLQERVEQIMEAHQERLRGNQIFNSGALVLEVKTGKVLAYVGNTSSGAAYQDEVDVVTARRSTGSILKPFLFAAMLDDGKMLPGTLMQDIPTTFQGFSPRNFSHQFDGAVPADKALIRSLNVPSVYQLRQYRYERFHSLLKSIGITSLNYPADHYGLTLILGGAEGTLWDITGVYASMARTLDNYFDHPGKIRYNKTDFHAPAYLTVPADSVGIATDESSWLSAASIWTTFDVLKELYRPGEETGWRQFESSRRIAWKTGTSLGFRDAWAVGVNPDYAVGVWVGNADGEGRPGLVGTETAAPVLFEIFSQLQGRIWFSRPASEMQQIAVCEISGQRATDLCLRKDTVWVGQNGLQSPPCQFHKLVHLSKDERYRLHSECSSLNDIKSVSWFVLPPVEEYYYRQRNISYRPLPSFRKDCAEPYSVAAMELIYPRINSRIYIPRELDGSLGQAVFSVAHRSPTATIFWHLDGKFIGSTQKSHRMALAPTEGEHILTLVDESGASLVRTFVILSKQ